MRAESICKLSKSKIFTRQRCSRARLSLFALACFDFDDNGRDGDDAGGGGGDAGDAGGDDNGRDGALMI